jgi:drug/metabolite transporter (DMT)-like permease
LLFNLLRMALAFLCLAVVYRRQWKHISPTGWKNGAILGLILAIAYQFQTSGLNLTTPSNSAFITGLTLVLVPLLAALPGVRRPGSKPPPWNVWLGVLLAFVGVALLAAPAKAGSGIFLLPDLGGIGAGDLLTLGCAFALPATSSFRTAFRIKNMGSMTAGSRPRVPACKQSPSSNLRFCSSAFARW